MISFRDCDQSAVVWHFFIFFQKKEQLHLEDPEPLP